MSLTLACREHVAVCYVERELAAAQILAARIEEGTLGDAPIWTDLATFDAAAWRGAVDCVVAGFPCPPVSTAGKRRGIEDDRWLWPEVWRITQQSGAGLLYLENVRGILSASDGAACGSILSDLADSGWSAEWTILSAAEVGASHQRERFFLLAVADSLGERGTGRGTARDMAGSQGGAEGEGVQRQRSGDTADHGGGDVGDTKCPRRQKTWTRAGKYPGEEPEAGGGMLLFAPGPGAREQWAAILRDFPWLAPAISAAEAQSAFHNLAPGLSDLVASTRADALRAAGNAVVAIQGAAAFAVLARRLGLDYLLED